MSNYGPETPYRMTGGPGEPRGVQVRNSVDLGGFFSILRRQRFWIIIGFLVTFGLAFVYITLAPLTYTSTISILIDARDRQPVGSDQAPLPQQADPIMVESQLKLMTSESVLRRVVTNEHLESDPEFAPSDHVGLISGLLGLIQRGAVAQPAAEQITDALFDRISVKRPDRTYVVDMDVKASSPGKAARLADAIAKAFIEEERSAADGYTQEQSDWVVKRTNELRSKVEAAEKRVQDYKAQNGIVDVAGTLTQEQQLQDANRDLVAARAKAAEAQSRVDQIRRIIASGKALDGTYDTINSTVIRQLRVQYSDLVRRQAAASQKYGTRHPEYLDIQEQLQAVRGQINDEMQRISSALTNEAQVARGNEDAAQKRVKTLESLTTDTNQTSLKLREFQRQADGERTNYEKFLRANDSIRRDLTETPYARIVAPASFPAKPSSPKVVAALLIAASGGLSLGIGLAVAMDYAVASPAPMAPLGGPTIDPWPGPTGGPAPGPRPGFGFAQPLQHEAPRSDPAPVVGREPVPEPRAESGFARLRTAVAGRRPLVAEHSRSEAAQSTSHPAQLPGYPGDQMPVTRSFLTAPASQDFSQGPVPPSQAPISNAPPHPAANTPSVASTSIDPRDLLAELVADLANHRPRRMVLTARMPTSQKTELALTMAKAAAARGHAVLVIDGDNREAGLSKMAIREGLPARIHFDQLEINVLGIPCAGDGVVFVLPLESVTGNMRIVDSPFIECRIGAVIVDGPARGPELAGFSGITDTCYMLDDHGYLHLLALSDAADGTASEIAAAAAPDMNPRRFAQIQHT
jgi:uncharacterized protein involved in exopolysaccharide biosynthesis